MPELLDLELLISEDGTMADKRQRAMVAAHLKMYAGRTCRFRVGSPKRTSAQNRYYWLILETIRRALHDAGEAGWMDRAAGCHMLHKHFAEKYLGVETITVFGVPHTRPVSTRRQERDLFHEYIESIRMDEDVLRLGVDIPDPDDYAQRNGEVFRSWAIQEPETT